MKNRWLTVFTLSAIGAGLLGHPASARASTTQNHPAIMCNSRDVSANAGSAGALNEYGQVANISCSHYNGQTTVAGVYHTPLATDLDEPNNFNILVIIMSPLGPNGSTNTIFGYSVTTG